MASESRPFLRVTWSDPDGPATGYVVVDRLVCGIATGGLRTRAGCTLTEVEDLAREGFAVLDEGLAMPDLIGGYGVAEAALAGLSGLGLAPDRSRAVVQGFGAMGGSSALYLHRGGVRVVGISDVYGLVRNTGRGLDVPALLRGRRPGGLIDRALLRDDDEQLPADAWLDVAAEV